MRDGRDSGVVMMAAAVEDCCGGQQRQRWTTIAADNAACMIGWQTKKGKDKSGRQETAETRSGNDGCRGGRWQWWITMAVVTTVTVDDNSGGRQRQLTMTARKIGRRTTRGKEESGRQTTMALDKRLISQPGRKREKINKSSLRKKTFFSNTVCPVGFIAPAKTGNVPF